MSKYRWLKFFFLPNYNWCFKPGPANTVKEHLPIYPVILVQNQPNPEFFVCDKCILCTTSILQISRSFKHVSWRYADFHSSLCERERSPNK